ncbi:hypothetical protein [Microbacterium alcoholitolerans]|uniref:hypothetical protein n=1 Tax=unclassified Microbacterium TaxID=2609290 RepID=UPI003D182733
MSGSGIWAGTLLIAVAALTGCGSGDGEAGFGLGDLSPQGRAEVLVSAGVSASALEGALAVAGNGCFLWEGDVGDSAWIVWPDSAEPDRSDGAGVILDDGSAVTDGSPLRGLGALVTLEDLPAGASPDSYFGSFGRFCGADEAGVIVLAEVTKG